MMDTACALAATGADVALHSNGHVLLVDGRWMGR